VSSIRVLIADDEPLARRGIRSLLSEYSDVEICGEARHGNEAIRLIRAYKPDLVFLDVQMPEADGFEVLRNIEYLPAVIFVTAYDTFAVKAFEANALDYLVKPVHESRFKAAFRKVRDRLNSKEAIDLSMRIAALLSAEEQPLSPVPGLAHTRRVLVIDGSTEILLDPKQIMWIEAADYYAAIHAGTRRYMLRESLSSLERRLDRAMFIRVHRTALVNLTHIQGIRNEADGQSFILLNSGAQLPLSRRRRSEVHRAIERFSGHALSTSQ
jgi:two-component system, LytTR family, response regulator